MISEKVLAVIARETGQTVTDQTSLDDLGLDSLEFLDLLLALGRETGKEIPDETVAGLKTVGDLAREYA